MTHAFPSRTRFATRLTPLLCLLLACVPVAAQSVSPPAQSAPAQDQTAAPGVKLSFIVATESGSSAVAVRREDVSVVEDGVPQTVTYFAREELPVSYGVLVDNSGSVRDIFHMVLRTAGSIVASNWPDDETFLIRFVDSGKIEEMQDFTSDRATLMNGLARMYIDGGQTAIIDAVYLSAVKVAERRPATSARRRSLVLITDGEDRASSYKLDNLLDLLRRTDVQIFSIGVGPRWPKERNKLVKDKKAKLLLELSQVTGGRAFFASDTAGLRAAVDEITRDLRARYVVGYTPTNADAGDKTRKVEVKVASQVAAAAGLTVTMRPAYSVPKAGGAKAEKKN